MTSLLFLLSSIVLTSWLTLSFKLVERFRINNLQAIVFNYISCVVTGTVVQGGSPWDETTITETWFPWALVMGAGFIAMFNLVAFIAQRIGVSVAVVAYKLSLVIPFVFSLYYYGDPYTIWKIAGIALALAAVVFTFWPSAEQKQAGSYEKDSKHPEGIMEQKEARNNKKDKAIEMLPEGVMAQNKKVPLLLWLAPLVLFIGSGLLDAMIKFVEQSFLGPANQDAYLITAFSSASSIGICLLGWIFATGRQRFDARAIVAGMAIGIPNYFSIWCLMYALKGYTGNSSVVIPVNNMGIVLISALAAGWLFKEKLSSINRLGIALSLAAIALIAFG